MRLSNARELGKKIKHARLISELTQIELAKKSGLAEGTIISIEQGCLKEPRPATIIKLAKALELDIDEMLKLLN